MDYALICAIILLSIGYPFFCMSMEIQQDTALTSPGENALQTKEEKTPGSNEMASLTIDEAVHFAIQNNPEIKAFEMEIDAAAARIVQERLFPNPSVFVETEDGSFKSFGFGNTYKATIGIIQPVSLGGKKGARVEVARREKEIAMLEYEMKLRDIVADTKNVFIQILVARQLMQIASDNLAVAQKLFDVAKVRVEAMAAPETELIKANIELANAHINFNKAELDLLRTEKQLNNLIGNHGLKIENYHDDLRRTLPVLNASKMEEIMLSTYPELLHAQKTRDVAQAHYKLAKTEKYPDIEVSLSAGREHLDLENNNSFQWSINVPLPFFNRNQGRLQEAKINENKAEKEYKSILNNAKLAMAQVLMMSEATVKQVKTYEEKILPQAEKSLELMSEGYREGQFTYIELLDAQRTLIKMREDYTQLLGQLNSSAVEIERLTGKTVEDIENFL